MRPGRPQFSWRGRYFNPIRGSLFRYPSGYRYRRWSIGAFLPSLFLAAPYYYDDCRGIGIEQSNPQGVVVHDTAEADEALAFIVTDTELPFPSFELVPGIGKFAQIAFQATSKIIVVSVDFKCPQTSFQ